MILTWIDRLESEARRPSSRLDLGVGGRRGSLAALASTPNDDANDDDDDDGDQSHGEKDTANLEKGKVSVV